MNEYNIRLEAYQLAQIDKQNDLLTQAWLNQQVQEVEGSGKHMRNKYTNPSQILDVDKAVDELRASWEPSYRKTGAASPYTKKKRAYDILNERYKKLMKMKQQKKGGSS